MCTTYLLVEQRYHSLLNTNSATLEQRMEDSTELWRSNTPSSGDDDNTGGEPRELGDYHPKAFNDGGESFSCSNVSPEVDSDNR